ncbi:type IV toxin-antitoxin system AbiEi family antitoxin domain-containing protein [Leifsonia sp. NPDC058230]|uniref:type IV toxin-antitoxin system AbiEi family antitoxin domain-containing protein n=1 Tax=Leifsonia sp. NPDC058230 TaxID=3346391 RepID=UPI0036DD9860
MQWIHHLSSRGGIASRAELTRAGAHPIELTAAVRAGRIVRPRRGTYALADTTGPMLEAARLGARLSCVSAARSYGWWAGFDPRLHLRVSASARSLPELGPDVVVHWKNSGAAREIWRVSPADCLRSVVRCADTETAVAVLDTAVASGSVRLSDLRAWFETEPKWTGFVAERARPGSESGIESIVRQRLTAAGHLVEQQVTVPGVGRVDLRIDGWLFVELDGFAYHSSREAFERDRIRDLAFATQGERRLRFTANQVLREWDAVRDAIRTVLSQEVSRAASAIHPS